MSKTTPPSVNVIPGDGWPTGRPGRLCAVSGRRLDAGEAVVAGLRRTGTGLERVDVAADAWPRADLRESLVAFWKTRVPAGDATPAPAVDDDTLVELVRRLDADEASAGLRFAVMLLLLRKRRLEFEGTVGDDGGRPAWRVRVKAPARHRATPDDEVIDVPDPGLDEAASLEVGRQVERLLAGDTAAVSAGEAA